MAREAVRRIGMCVPTGDLSGSRTLAYRTFLKLLSGMV